MTLFTEHGFLTGIPHEDTPFYQALYEKHGPDIDICREINTAAQQLVYKLKVRNEYNPEIVSSILYTRVLMAYQSALILSFKGMKPMVEILVRCLMEPLFPLVAISRDLAFADKFVLAEEHHRLRTLEGFGQYKKRKKEVDLKFDRELLKEIKRNIKEKQIEDFSVRAYARHADMLDDYDTVYAFTSATLHASPRSLENALELSAERKIVAIKMEPELDGYEMFYVTLVGYMVKAMQAVSTVFKIPYPEIIDTRKRMSVEISRNQDADKPF